ncbi:unnamed protein product [Porites lobata]|uniref:Uncharacterized protein n=1 Tax=Porites lobata TaxID=104759 RepID=A0ABN8PTI2_9CNID|nr:unnamed protein product [Porites lobata]
MHSRSLFIVIALWLILSCFLLDHAEGFVYRPGKKKHHHKRRGRKYNLKVEKAVRDFASFLRAALKAPANKKETETTLGSKPVKLKRPYLLTES